MEYKFVMLPDLVKTGGNVEERATIELNAYANRGWEVVNATRPQLLGAIGFLLRRPKP